MSSWVIYCEFNRVLQLTPRGINPSELCSATITPRVTSLSVEKCSCVQVPGTVILTYSFWLRQRDCIKGIAKSWVFVKWRWMRWFGMKVIFYLGSDALCLVMQQPLSQQHDSPWKWILIRWGWCFFSFSTRFSLFFYTPSISPPLHPPLSLSLSCCF